MGEGTGDDGGGSGEIDLEKSSFQISPDFGTPADGASAARVEVLLVDRLGDPVPGALIELTATGFGNRLPLLPATDAAGRSGGPMASIACEEKRVSARVTLGERAVEIGQRRVVFLQIPPLTYFVRTSGSDAADGRTPNTAWQTIDHALENSGPGATIHVGAGTYAGPLTLRLDSRGAARFLLDGDRSGTFTDDAGEVIIAAGGASAGLYLSEAHNVVVQGFTLSGGEAGLRIADSSAVRVLDCRPQENSIGLSIRDSVDVVVQDCIVSENLDDGVQVQGASWLCIKNNLVYNNGSNGIALSPPCSNASIRFNTLYQNLASQIREDQPGGTGKIAENIVDASGGRGFDLLQGTSYTVRTNLVWGASTPKYPYQIEAEPLFRDPFGPDGILGGIGEQDDDFRVLTHSASLNSGNSLARDVLLGSREALSTRTTVVSRELDGSGTDLSASNLGFHYMVAADPFRSLAPGGGRIAHSLPGDVRPHLCDWDRSSPLVATDALAPRCNAEIVHLEHRVSPLDRPEEIVAAQLDTGTRGEIRVQAWDGRRFVTAIDAPYVGAIPREELADRCFDIEYEERSGSALFVFGDGDAIPSFQVLENGDWSVPRDVFSASPVPGSAGRVRWIELVTRRRTDELALVFLDDQRDLVVSLWDGAAFGPPRLLETNTLFTSGWRPFDAAFESLSGDFLVTWGFNTFIEETRWAAFEGQSGQWRTGQHPSTDAVGADVHLASDPISDRIAAVMGEGDFDNDVIVSVWDGSAWVDTAELTLAGPLENRLLEVAWIGNTGVAFVVFRRQGHQGSFNVALLLEHGWRIQPDVILPGVDRAGKVRLVSLPDKNQLLGSVLDLSGRLFGLHYDGQKLALLNDGQPLAVGLNPLAPGRPFDAAVRRSALPIQDLESGRTVVNRAPAPREELFMDPRLRR